MVTGVNLRLMGSGVATYLGGRDAESNNYRSDSTIRLHPVRNTRLVSLFARRERVVIR